MPSTNYESIERSDNGFPITQKILEKFELKKYQANGQFDCRKAKEVFDSVIDDTKYNVWLDGTMVGIRRLF